MTAQQTRPNLTDLFASLRTSLGGAFALAMKVVLGLAILMAAGMLALMTAIAGLVLAGLALLMRVFTRPGTVPSWSEDNRYRSEDGTVTLDARRTPRGWTVE